ncbi:unnamed protein product [Paramecium sonneborni]|uniref:Uncharacterized protein n=1 Tax=Paramecium sonneborni TaxID=65129 RepID=A0A8S1MIU1_9CILI|nr:unnamed protein product [Paramecium sonneborni]
MFKSFKKSTSNQNNSSSQSSQDSISLEQQRTIQQLKFQRDKIEKIIEEYWQRIDKLDQMIKGYISAGKKIAAKGCIGEMQSLKKQIEIHHTKVNLIIKMIIDLESMNQDHQLVTAMQQATSLFQQQEQFNEQLTNNLEYWKDLMDVQQERTDFFKDMDQKFNNQDDIEETLKQYEQEVELENMTKQLNSVPNQQINAVKVNLPIQKNNSQRLELLN